jgi:hypothetical protein
VELAAIPGRDYHNAWPSISDDGMRAYVSQAFVGDASAGATARNGVLVLDVSDFQIE